LEAKTFAMVGGDRRNIELARMLHTQGHTVKMYGFKNYEKELSIQCNTLLETVEGSNCIIGPIPCSHNGEILNTPFHNKPISIEELFSLIKPQQQFLAGVIKPEVLEIADKYNISTIDMLKREELLIRNAIPTAEGAIKIAIDETDITLHGSRAMVIGYGRIGKVLSGMLRGLGVEVLAVVNTDEAAAFAESNGHWSVLYKEMESKLQFADVIFNTVPQILLDKNNMQHIRKDTLIIDLASPPYGVEVNDSRDFGLKVLYTNSLPGKIAPVTTASYILETVNRILEEKEGEQNEPI